MDTKKHTKCYRRERCNQIATGRIGEKSDFETKKSPPKRANIVLILSDPI